jgi:hypothetical protein
MVSHQLGGSGARRRCYSARGPDADRHGKLLINLALEGSRFGADSQRQGGREIGTPGCAVCRELFTCGFTVTPGAFCQGKARPT